MKLNTAWFLFYGRKLGMKRSEILSCPYGEMLDYINCVSIQNGAMPKRYGTIRELEEVR